MLNSVKHHHDNVLLGMEICVQNEELITRKHLLNKNRMIKSSHPLFEGGTAENMPTSPYLLAPL